MGSLSESGRRDLTSVISPGLRPSISFRLLGILFWSFSEWGSFLRLSISGVLVLFGIVSCQVQQRYFNAEIRDPAICHYVVSGRVYHETMDTTSPATSSWLGARPWLALDPEQQHSPPKRPTGSHRSISEIERQEHEGLFETLTLGGGSLLGASGKDCAAIPAAWPRFALISNEVDLPDPDEGCDVYNLGTKSASRIDAMLSHRNEPVLSRVVLDISNDPNSATVRDVLTSLRPGTLGIVLSTDYVDKLTEAEAGDKSLEERTAYLMQIGTVCVAIGSKYEDVKVLGIAERLFHDRSYIYDAIMPLELYEKRLGDSLPYDSIAIYFEPHEIERLRKFLDPDKIRSDNDRESEIRDARIDRFNFDPEALKRVERSITASRFLSAVLMISALLIGALTILMVASSYASQITTNERPLAMLRSLGLPRVFLRKILTVHMHFVWGLAFAFITITYFVYLVVGAPLLADYASFDIRLSILRGEGLELAFPVLGTAILWAISYIVIVWRLRTWLNSAELRLGDILKSGG